MKYAFWPGCVAKGACPELYQATVKVAGHLGIELVELFDGNCTGAGVIGEHEPEVADILNARNFALAEREGLPLMNICSTCQGVQSLVQHRLASDADYLARINEKLADEGLHYSGNLTVKNLLWVLVEDYGLDKLRAAVRRPITGLRAGPFYGCYIIRPTILLGYDDHPERGKYLEQVIEAVGAEAIDYEGKDKCCGFPILTVNRRNSLTMAGTHIHEADEKGADCLVTPCPLCHLNLDGLQPAAAGVTRWRLEVPILHLPQLVGLALGFPPKDLRLDRHVVPTRRVTSKLAASVGA